MKVAQANSKLDAEHGVVASYPDQFFGYFGWPTVGRMDDGQLFVATSGLRNYHVCPFGRTVICTSNDDGKTWGSPRVINDTPLDDRDAGVISLGPGKLLLAWFTVDSRSDKPSEYEKKLDALGAKRWREGRARVTDESVTQCAGSWVRLSNDAGITWGDPIRVNVSAPHGPIQLRSGDLIYFGKELAPAGLGWSMSSGQVTAIKGTDGGRIWERLGSVPLPADMDTEYFHEPHVMELPDGRLVGLIRCDPSHHDYHNRQPGQTDFELFQSISSDGGSTWSTAEPLGFHGSPPHLLSHSSGTLICSYSYREEPYGVRVMISRDGAKNWEYDHILRDDGPHPDLGYPSSVELGDGSVLTVYYQRPTSAKDMCALLWSRWRLPD
jgi:hypothetical protein